MENLAEKRLRQLRFNDLQRIRSEVQDTLHPRVYDESTVALQRPAGKAASRRVTPR